MRTCRGCEGTCCTGVGSDPCTCESELRLGRDLAYALGETRGGRTVVTRKREVLGAAEEEGMTLTVAANLEDGEWAFYRPPPHMSHNTRLLPWRGGAESELYPEFEANARLGRDAGEEWMVDLLDPQLAEWVLGYEGGH